MVEEVAGGISCSFTNQTGKKLRSSRNAGPGAAKQSSSRQSAGRRGRRKEGADKRQPSIPLISTSLSKRLPTVKT